MPKSVFLSGWEDGFSEALRDRLERANVNLCSNKDSSELTIGLGENASGDLVILPSGLQSDDSRIEISVHDLVVPVGGNSWGTAPISKWVHEIKNGLEPEFDPEGIHYWVHVRDVVEGICSVVIADDFAPLVSRMDICGRRAWRDSDVVNEIDQLWQRYQNALSHSHTVSSLASISSPVKEALEIDGLRPNLGPFHKAILNSGGMGWHPTVQMRTSLMELIAASEMAVG